MIPAAEGRTEPAKRSADIISPRVRALEVLIEASLDDLERPDGRTTGTSEALLFIGNWNDALPRLLIHDPVLEPVDKIVWAVIKTCTDPRRGTAFPNYPTIARLANVSAEGTVTRALAILRVTRWLTLCGRARDGRGRFRGSVYALHDEPLSLADTLHLDPAYMDFTVRATSHGHARVSLVASGVIRSLELDVAEDKSVETAADPVIARIEAQLLVQHRQREPAASPPSSASTSRGRSRLFSRSFATRFEVLPEPSPADSGPAPPPNADPDQPQKLGTVIPRILENIAAAHRLQNLKVVGPQNLGPQNLSPPPDPHSSSCSSKEKAFTTTTTNGVVVENPLHARAMEGREPAEAKNDQAAALALYRWPAWLSPNARHLAVLELRRAPASLRQTVIDLLDRRRQDGEAAIADRLHHPIQYLRSLCQLAAAGKIVQREEPPASPATGRSNDTRTVVPEHLRQRLRAAESDHRYWQRLIDLTDDPHRKRECGAELERAKAEIERCQAALGSRSDAERRP